jgi:UDP-glucose 4-epimerase
MLIAIYGANGFIGKHLLHRLSADGRQVRAFSRRFDKALVHGLSDRVELVEGDFFHSFERASALDDVDVVVHLISTSSPGLRNDHAVMDIHENVIPHIEFLQECISHNVKRFIFLSSGGTVYGPHAPLPAGEDVQTRPICSHGVTKVTVENYVRMYSYLEGIDHVILRVANPYGPGQVFKKSQGLIPAILDRVRRQMAIHIYGTGEARRDFVYIDDVVDAIRTCIDFRGKLNETINIGSGRSLSINEVISNIEKELGEKIEKEYLPSRSTDVSASQLDVQRALRLLDWSPKISFQEGLQRTIKAFAN